jgi:hypothetical protein
VSRVLGYFCFGWLGKTGTIATFGHIGRNWVLSHELKQQFASGSSIIVSIILPNRFKVSTVLVELYVSPRPSQLRVGVLVVISLHADVSRLESHS